MSSVLDSAYRLVRAYPGGASSLAPRLGKSASTLSHEVNPPAHSTAKLGLVTAVDMSVLARDFSILNAFAAEMHAVVLPLPDALGPDEDLAQQTALLAKEFSDLMVEISVSTADRRISDNELQRLQTVWGELVQAGQHLLTTFRHLNEGTGGDR